MSNGQEDREMDKLAGPSLSSDRLEAKSTFDVQDRPLPSPVTATPSKAKPKLTATIIIPIWIILSSSVILYNNHVYNTLQFKFPVFLVTWHLTFAVCTADPFIP